MKTFKDTVGRIWSLNLSVDAVKRVRSLANVNLLEAIEGKLIDRLGNDPVLLCDVLYALVKPDADAQNVTDVEFGRALGGDAIECATNALLEELVDFFPQPRRRLLAKALGKLKMFEAKALSLAEKRLESAELDARLESALANVGGSSGN